MEKNFLLIILSIIFIVNSFYLVSAWELNGSVYNINGTALYNATINVTVYNQNFQVQGYIATYSNQTGWFNLTVTNNATWMYRIVITHFENNATNGTTPIDFIGQSLPAFPFQEMNMTGGISTNFYLKEAGTINLTAVNATGQSVTFQYVIKDQTLGYPISEDFQNYASQKTIYIPRDRNYSIMIFPNQSMPVSFNWNNFSSTNSYNISTPSNSINLSTYNATTHTLHKQFNTTMNLIWVSGNTTNSSGQSLVWDEFKIIPFILEAGNMIFLGSGGMPHNMSAWWHNSTDGSLLNYTDQYNLSTGFYNITLIGPAESADYILFATARNGANYYGGYRNISLNYSSSGTQVNFTMWPLMSTDWNSSNSNITMNDAQNWNTINVSTARRGFNLVNSTSILSQVSAHIEATVDYSSYNATEFTFMLDVTQTGNASFYLPLINSTGIKEINVYSQMYAPKRVGTRTSAEISANNNITLSTFNPGDIEGEISDSNIFMELYKSNSTCDVPTPSSSCTLGSSSNMGNFNPLNSIIGGGKISFRMGYGNIEIHYVNVDMLASGPPDALFDDSATTTTSGDFESALRFGSLGPTIYDYVLVSMPYTPGTSSQTGLDESGQVNISIPLFYDENSSGVMNWNTPIWNTTANGTNGTLFSANHSHFNTYSQQWQTLMGNNTCVTNVSTFNSTNPCYIDTANNQIWIRLPHFSGNKPLVSGSVITATSSSSGSSGGGGGGSTPSSNEWSNQKIQVWVTANSGVPNIMKDFDSEIGIKEINFMVKDTSNNVKLTVRKFNEKPSNISVAKSGKVYQYVQINTDNLGDNLESAVIRFRAEKSWATNNSISKENISISKYDETANKWNELTTTFVEEDNTYNYYDVELNSFSYFAISEKSVSAGEGTEGEEEENGIGNVAGKIINKASANWIWVIIGIVAVLILLGVIRAKKR